jgi:hypothetical protein
MRLIPLFLMSVLVAWGPAFGEDSDVVERDDTGFSSIPDFLAKHKKAVDERDGLKVELAKISSQRTLLLWYSLGATAVAGLLAFRLLKAMQGGIRIIAAPAVEPSQAEAAASVPTPLPQGRGFRDRESSGTATVTVRDGSTQRVVTTGRVATRRVVNRKITNRITNPALPPESVEEDPASQSRSGTTGLFQAQDLAKPEVHMDDLDFGEVDRPSGTPREQT